MRRAQPRGRYRRAVAGPLRDAVERNLTVIAEATLSLDEMQEAGVAQEVSQYKRIIGFRIHLTHRYYELNDGIVWRTVLHDLPILRAETQALLNSPERSGAD